MTVIAWRRGLGCRGIRNNNSRLPLLSLAGLAALRVLTFRSSSYSLLAEAFRVTADAVLPGAVSSSCSWESDLHQSDWGHSSGSSSSDGTGGGSSEFISSNENSNSRTSRGAFLRDHALGVGLSLATGLSYEPQPGYTLFGKREPAV